MIDLDFPNILLSQCDISGKHVLLVLLGIELQLLLGVLLVLHRVGLHLHQVEIVASMTLLSTV